MYVELEMTQILRVSRVTYSTRTVDDAFDVERPWRLCTQELITPHVVLYTVHILRTSAI